MADLPDGAAGPGEEPQRPRAIPLVLTWNLLLAVVAFFTAIAPFSGAVEVTGGRAVELPLVVQLLDALASAAGGAALVLVSIALIRQQRWVRRAQVVLLAAAGLVGLGSYVTVALLQGEHLEPAVLLVTVLAGLIDALAITAMTSRRVVAWYHEPGPVPLYLGLLIVFWLVWTVAHVLIVGRT